METRSLLKPFLLIAGMVLLFSCDKDFVQNEIEPNTTRVIVEFTESSTGSAVAAGFSDEFEVITVTPIRINTRSIVTGNQTVKVKVIPSPTVVADYNSANGTAYESLPTALYSFEPQEITLSQDEREKMVSIRLKTSSIADGNYAIGLAIAEVDGGEISKTANYVMAIISVKNDYDGIYRLKGYANIPGSQFIGPFSLGCAAEVALITSGTNSVYVDPGQFTYSSSGVVFLTNVLPDFVIDPSSNKVTAVNARTGSLGTVFPQDAAYDSRFDPATKTLYVKYGISSLASGRYFVDTFEYCRPR